MTLPKNRVFVYLDRSGEGVERVTADRPWDTEVVIVDQWPSPDDNLLEEVPVEQHHDG